jgi:hypothetical protein
MNCNQLQNIVIFNLRSSLDFGTEALIPEKNKKLLKIYAIHKDLQP